MSCVWKSKEKKNTAVKMQRSNKGKMISSMPMGLSFLLQSGYIPDFGFLGYLSFFPIHYCLSSNWPELAPFTYCRKN